MTLVLNVLWVILGGGFITALEYVLAGVVCCLTIVGIPFGLQCFKIAGLALLPFGRDFDDSRRTPGALPLNIIWVIFAGVWIFISHLTLGVACAVSIIGIPFALQHLKLAFLALAPFGVTIRQRRY